MDNLYLLIGEELLLKDLRINEILKEMDDYELKTLYLDSYKGESYKQIANDINLFLGTFDFFSSTKVLKLVLNKPVQVNSILSRINNFDSDNKLIIDLRCPDYMIRNMKFEYLGKSIKSETFFKFKDYELEKVKKYILKCFNENEINFESDYDLEHAINYLFNNGLNSYSFIYHQINKIKLLNKDVLKYDDITFTTGGLSDKNSYRICDNIFKSDSVEYIVNYLEDTLCISDSKSFLMLLNTLVNKLHDYILLNEGKMCKVKANYYIFKNSKIKVFKCNEFIVKINNLIIKSKKSTEIFKEEFLILILEHLYIENT